MSLRSATEQALAQCTAASLPGVVAACDGDLELTSDLVALDSLACAFGRLTVGSPSLAGASEARLRQLSDTLSKRLNYLLEPIAPVEVDREQSVIQMRSKPPQKDDTGSTYYELLVRRGGDVTLRRYRKSPGQPREIIPAQVTREVFLRLVADFAAVL